MQRACTVARGSAGVLALVLACGCASSIGTERTRMDARVPLAPDAGPPGFDAGGPVDAGPPLPDPIPCTFYSDSFGSGPMRLDVPTGAPDRMTFTVRGVPAPDLVVVAMLEFDTFDADHPGEEGLIWVNGNDPIDVPADPGLDMMPSSESVDVTGLTVEGDNEVLFGPGSLVPGTFFEISNLALALEVRLDACP